MRLTVSWIIGILVFLGVFVSIDLAAAFSGLPTRIDYGDTITIRYSSFAEGESDGTVTALGFFMAFLALASGIRAGMAVYVGHWSGGVGKLGNLQLVIATACIGTYALIMTTAWQIFGRIFYRAPTIVPNLFEILVAGTCAWAGFWFYKNKVLKEK